jgi:hypothetical protein
MLDGPACAWGRAIWMSEDRGVPITLSDAQVAQVVREASGGAGLSTLMGGLSDPQTLRISVLALTGENGYSQSVLRALLVLGAFPADGTERTLKDVAEQLAFSASTVHRYAVTWMAVGLLEQDHRSRRYRRAPQR